MTFRIFILISAILFNNLFCTAQNWLDNLYHEVTENCEEYDFSDLWINNTFQGTIDDHYQRIEMRFLSVIKDELNPKKYNVKGKSKVNSNICDFEGSFLIHSLRIIKDTINLGESPEISLGFLKGEYELNENPNQNHVGAFKGEFYINFDKDNDRYTIFSGLYYDDENFTCNGIWQEYSKNKEKQCSWGLIIPPYSESGLIRKYENGYYIINHKYLNKEWKSYALSNENVIVIKDFYSEKGIYQDDVLNYSKNEINKSKIIESNEWWK